jgi:beta-lactamase superfamily II metal-dependent hydrolase
MSSMSDHARTAELVILDVGHGNAAVIHENAHTILIDTALGSHVLEYLQQRKINSLDLIVLSHSDQDHIGGLMAILNAGIHVGLVLLNTDSEKQSTIWGDLIISLEDARRNGDIDFKVGLSSGKLPVDDLKHCELEIISPTPGLAAMGPGSFDRNKRKITSNSISACIRLLFDKKPIALLASDMDAVALDEALAAKAEMQAKVLVYPHHGGLPGASAPEEFTAKLLAAVKPDSVIFSLGRAKHDNPRPEIINAITNSNPAIILACTQLSTQCAKVLPTNLRKYHFPIYSAGAVKNSCCAGSIVIDLNTSNIDQNIINGHKDFVDGHVPNPLCRLHRTSGSAH